MTNLALPTCATSFLVTVGTDGVGCSFFSSVVSSEGVSADDGTTTTLSVAATAAASTFFSSSPPSIGSSTTDSINSSDALSSRFTKHLNDCISPFSFVYIQIAAYPSAQIIPSASFKNLVDFSLPFSPRVPSVTMRNPTSFVLCSTLSISHSSLSATPLTMLSIAFFRLINFVGLAIICVFVKGFSAGTLGTFGFFGTFSGFAGCNPSARHTSNRLL